MSIALQLEEIKACIGHWLSRRDILACMCVSRDWHMSFRPLLFRHLVFGPKASSMDNPRLRIARANQAYIRRLSFHQCEIPACFAWETPINLNSLYLDFLVRTRSGSYYYPNRLSCDEESQLMSTLVLNQAASLRRIHVVGSDTMPSHFLSALGQCRALERLRLHNLRIDKLSYPELLRLCLGGRSPRSLELSGVELMEWYPKLDEHLTPSKDQDPDTQSSVQELTVLNFSIASSPTSSPNKARDAFVDFIKHLSGLTTLAFTMDRPASKPFPTRAFCLAIQSSCWLQLSSLDLSFRDISDLEWLTIVESVQSMVSLKAKRTQFGQRACEALLAKHALTLQHLDLHESQVPSHSLQAIMAKMPHLRTLSIDPIWIMDIVDGAPWVCPHLLKLATGIDFGPGRGNEAPKVETLDTSGDKDRIIFERLATLTRLKTLELRALDYSFGSSRYRSLDLRLVSGLNLLAHWTQLEELMCRSGGLRMTMKDAEWMRDHWRSLWKIQGTLSENPEEYYPIKRMLNNSGISVFDTER